jgi:hypothetical protein
VAETLRKTELELLELATAQVVAVETLLAAVAVALARKAYFTY